MRSEKKEFCSTKLSYYARDPIHGIDLEFLQTHKQLNIYLNIHSVPVPPYDDRENCKFALVILEVAGKKITAQAYRLEGGQRFLLPQDMVETLIQSLKAQEKVILSLGSYRSKIAQEDFSLKFDQLQHSKLNIVPRLW